MTTAKIFRSGNSQAVRLPKAFRFDSQEVEIYRRGDEIVLREKRPNLAAAFDALTDLPDDMIDALEHRDDPLPEERERL
ncbi:virulence-associated protein-like protein [Salinisphaera dokdonensis CL-ES53]|uniref:Virulence-associated protein-like protein n=1 Tax=Salinisphaera dokdonensis CL-ES53 TaxID=1304272 RepID=A0ABV2AYY6_9GAMM